MKDLKSKMEVLIFISENPISLKNISEFLNIDKNEAEILINDLMNEINNLRRSFKLEKIADGYQFRTNEDYKNLIKEFINIDISKQFQSSDFGGELTPAQLKYCANDVIYLHKIHEELIKILERENRLKLYEDCLKFLKTRVDLDLALFKDDIWSH